IVSSPNAGSSYNILYGVGAVPGFPGDVWAVGYYVNGSNADQTLTEKWNGTTWTLGSNSNLGSLGGIAMVSTTDIWAVGSYHNVSVDQTLTLHGNGTTWSSTPSPNSGSGSNYLKGVA